MGGAESWIATEPATGDPADMERKLAAWAAKRGIDWAMAREEITAEDIPHFARYLRYARTHNAPEETACVEICLKLAERRAKARLQESAERIAALTEELKMQEAA